MDRGRNLGDILSTSISTTGGLLVPEGIIHQVVSTDMVYYIYLLLKFPVPK